MSTLISPADFTVDNQLPNISLQANDIQAYINKYELLFLSLLMEDDLYAAYIANPTDARFVTLIGQPWFKPAIVDFVYFHYARSLATFTMNTGGGQPKKQNATTVSLYPKMVYAWNEMVEYNKKTNKFLKDNATTYPEYKPIHFPEWWFAYDGFNWFYPSFETTWYWGFGCKQLPEIYRLKNSLGV